MSQHLSRLLNDPESVRSFLNDVLKYDYSHLENIVEDIVDGELGVVNNYNSQTLYSTKFRNESFHSDKARWSLRKQIINELLSLKRLNHDEDIYLGNGGALPNLDTISNKQAFIIIGLPASGKSDIASNIADEFSAIVIDSDFAKRKLPEFKKHLYGATIVHEESSQITFGFGTNNEYGIKSVYEISLENEFNIVLPKIGQSPKNILDIAKSLKEMNGYEVHLISIELMKRDATIRAVNRFNETKRYVPLGLIFDGYGNDPSLCYYYLRCKYPDFFTSFGALSTNVPKGDSPLCTDYFGNSPVLKYEQKELILQ